MQTRKPIIASLAVIVLLLVNGLQARSQWIHCQHGDVYYQERISIDTDILQNRFNTTPYAYCNFDDFTQYIPLGLTYGLKVFGYESRSGWGRMAVGTAASVSLVVVTVNGLKYSVKRMRPDESASNSFPSGHTATAFMAATILHKEYGWRSPWFSIGGYTVAFLSGYARILNNRHWFSDVVAGAAIGIGVTHLGYFLTDLIFKDRQIADGYERTPWREYTQGISHCEFGALFGQRIVLGSQSAKDQGLIPYRGGTIGAFAMIPLTNMSGISARVSSSSLMFSDGYLYMGTPGASSMEMYSALVGGYWIVPVTKFLETSLRALVGYNWQAVGNGIDLVGGAGLAARIGENFRIKAFAECETFSFSRQRPFVPSVVIGMAVAASW